MSEQTPKKSSETSNIVFRTLFGGITIWEALLNRHLFRFQNRDTNDDQKKGKWHACKLKQSTKLTTQPVRMSSIYISHLYGLFFHSQQPTTLVNLVGCSIPYIPWLGTFDDLLIYKCGRRPNIVATWLRMYLEIVQFTVVTSADHLCKELGWHLGLLCDLFLSKQIMLQALNRNCLEEFRQKVKGIQ